MKPSEALAAAPVEATVDPLDGLSRKVRTQAKKITGLGFEEFLELGLWMNREAQRRRAELAAGYAEIGGDA